MPNAIKWFGNFVGPKVSSVRIATPPKSPEMDTMKHGRLTEWGYSHQTVCHPHGAYARDEDGDGFHEVQVNTMASCWSLLRSWLRPHRGVSQERLPVYIGFFQFVHSARQRGNSLLRSLVEALVAVNPVSG